MTPPGASIEEMERLFRGAVRGCLTPLEPLRDHTSFRIGGPADLFFQPKDQEDLRAAVTVARRHAIPCFVLGGGNNLLVADDGIEGLVIKLGRPFARLEFLEDRIVAGAGLATSVLLRECLEHEIAGFEFLAGVPGTLGGALVMNAGTYLGEIVEVLVEATLLTEAGDLRVMKADELGLAYRTSRIPPGWIALDLVMRRTPGVRDEIAAKIRKLREGRKNSQPLTLPNAGSIFKNPPMEYAWKLIDAVEGRGMRRGDAQVSEKHANFIVNLGNAKGSEVLALMRELQRRVEERCGVHLVPEVKLVGRWFEPLPR